MGNLEEAVEFLDQQPRCPCVLILDTSGSMSGSRIAALNEGLNIFRDELVKDELAKKRIEIAIVEFNSVVRIVQDFVTAEHFHPPTLKASGGTDIVEGIQQALDLIKRRKTRYKDNGVPFYRPWAFLITDGQATGYEEIATRIKDEEANKRVAFFAVGVEGADLNCLRNISAREPKMLAGINFRDLFLWLSTSMQKVSNSMPGEMVPMEKPSWEAV
jgi:uncharacterized protein YegL